MVKILPFSAGNVGSIPGQGAKIPHVSRPKTQNIKQKQYCNKFNKDLIKRQHTTCSQKAYRFHCIQIDEMLMNFGEFIHQTFAD